MTDQKLRAVVTGASSGIGAATVRQLRALNWDVVEVARREDKLKALAEETGATYIVADMTSDDDVTRMAEEVRAQGPVHSLVANAGFALGTDEVMVATDEFSLKRLGSQEAADKVYEGVERPLTAEDVADAVVYTLTRPHHFNVDLMVIRPIAQAAQHKVARNSGL